MTETEDRGSRLQGRTDAVEGLFRTKLGASVDPDEILRGVRERLRAERSGAAARFWPARLAWAAAAALMFTAAFLGFGLGRSTARLRASAGRLAELDPLGTETPEEERR